MTVTLSASFAFDLAPDASALLQFEVAKQPNQHTLEAHTEITGARNVRRVAAQDAIGERVWVQAQGRVEVHYKARVRFNRALAPLASLHPVPLHLLPGEAAQYLLDSRYCQSAPIAAFAADRFGQIDSGAKVATVRDWVQNHIAYTPGASDSDTTATHTFHSARGVCRDYAHVFIALMRACAIPARYVACYAPGVEPPDFHALCEVFLANPEHDNQAEWHLIDPSGMADLSRAAVIGVGRDAGDVSFLTSFGAMQFVSSHVRVCADAAALSQDPAPIHTPTLAAQSV
jgi:transglutaminase-like putative cysteine protease